MSAFPSKARPQLPRRARSAGALLSCCCATLFAFAVRASQPVQPEDLCDGNDPCPIGEPCDTGLGGQCGPGIMRLVGTELVCEQIHRPAAEICDGLDNDCDGLSDEQGVCGCGGREGCACLDERDCASGHFCRHPLETCGGDGACVAIPVGGCPETGSAVCGCDDRTYANDCEAMLARQSLLLERACRRPCETCDPPDSPAGPSGNACRIDCTVCGDGILDPGEACDDGNSVDQDGCRNRCALPRCGDRIRDPTESCDPPGSPAGATGNPCRANCTVCGDALGDLGEECDDGNDAEADACATDCVAAAAGEIEPASLRVDRSPGGDVLLSWGTSCGTVDDDFEVYAGALGEFSSHAPVTCSTAGAVAATVPASETDAYYLVVPRTTYREGSYGLSSGGAERPASLSACLPQKLGGCQ